MGIFGQLDAANVKANAYFIEAGTYKAEVTKAYFKENSQGQRQLTLVFQITNEDSLYQDKTASYFFNLPDADLTAETLALLPVDEQKKINDTLSKMKRTLCGNGGRQKGLGVSPDDLNDADWNPAVLVGTKVNIGIKNYGEDGVNISWVNLDEE